MTIDPVQYARRWKTLGVLSLSLVIIGLDTTILNVALPTLQDEFDASSSKLQRVSCNSIHIEKIVNQSGHMPRLTLNQIHRPSEFRVQRSP